jgi:hypothetical protein
MAVNPNVDFVSGAILLASQQNRFPRGVMGFVQRTAGDVGPFTSETDVTGMTITFTAVANRLYRVSTGVTGQKNTSTGFVYVNIKDVGSGALLNQVISTTSPAGYVNLSTNGLITGSGSTSIKMTFGAENASATILAGATTRCTMIVEDLGPY